MTSDKLDVIKARLEAATPGPWYRFPVKGYTDDYVRTRHPDHQQKPHGSHIAEVGYATGHEKQNFSQDAEFMAEARQDIPYLIARLEASEAEIERLREGWPPSDEFEVTGTSRDVCTRALTGITVRDPETKTFVGFVCIDRYYERENRTLAAEAEVERLRRSVAGAERFIKDLAAENGRLRFEVRERAK